MQKNIFYLTGFMASGKSTIGPMIANSLGWDFFDLDKEIERNEAVKIKDIFKMKGEKYFRSVETGLLKKLSAKNNVIVALGGGTIASEINFKIINSSGLLIYLKTSPEIAYRRLKFKRDRPALIFEGDELPDKKDFIERINLILDKRKKYYEKADFTIETDSLPVGKTVDAIVRFIEKRIKQS